MAGFLNRLGIGRTISRNDDSVAAENASAPKSVFLPRIYLEKHDVEQQRIRLMTYYIEIDRYMKASRASGTPDTLKESGGSPNPLTKQGENYSRKRSSNLSIHVTPQEKNMIRRKAQQANMTMTDYIISAIQGDEIIVCDGLVPLFVELKRIGNNVNQIAYKVNSGVVSAVGLRETQQELNKISERIEEIARKINGDS